MEQPEPGNRRLKTGRIAHTQNTMFNTTKKEDALILEIANRASRELNCGDVVSTHMDLAAVHTHDCALDFRKLMAFDAAEFAHDIHGINLHLDREIFKLRHCFLPRCALASRATDTPALEAVQGLRQVLNGLRDDERKIQELNDLSDDERKIQEQVREYTLLLDQLSATGVWTPVEQAELVELRPYFVRLTSSPEHVMIVKWTDFGWGAQKGEPGEPTTLEVLVA